MIPKIIHQLWIGPKKAPTEMMETWKKFHPDWDYIFWNEETILKNFSKGLYNQQQYDSMPEWNGKCDIARYEILQKFGGFFIDADSICKRKLDNYLLENDSFSCYENELLRGQLIAAGYLGCVQGCELMNHLVMRLHGLSGEALHQGPMTAWKTVGPLFLTQTVNELKYTKLAVYPSFYFIPSHYTEKCLYNGPFKPYAEQFWGSTETLNGKVGMEYDTYSKNKNSGALEGMNSSPEEKRNQSLITAIDYLEKEDFDKSRKHFSEIIQNNPLSEEAIYGLALCSKNQDDILKALEYINELLRINPNHSEAWNQFGLIMVDKGNLADAKKGFITSIEKNPGSVEVQRNLAELYLLEGDFELGVQAYLSILKNYPDDVPTLLRMAELNAEADNKELASEWANLVLNIEPDNSLAVQHVLKHD
ncbi:uncharacterized protein METZ01_LOCUS79258 [marine metagenome]|uniref:Uncharacterized protein n=1 Tax=marine metagenome TaxID=408172 RepID=A0A381UEL6_9ZZZZ